MTDIKEIINEIKVLEKKQKEAELELSNYRGQYESEMKRLKEEFKLENLKDAEKMLDKLQAKIKKIDELAISKFEVLKEKYDVI